MLRAPIPSLGIPVLLAFACAAAAAPPDRITRPVDGRQMRAVRGSLHHLAQARFDQGAVDPAMPMEYMMVLFQPSSGQQAELDSLLASQQNPSSPLFHQWLTPEEFGNRFGLSPGDRSKVVQWLHSEGFEVKELGRGRNWVAFSGAAAQVAKSLHTAIHRFRVAGETHYANVSEASVPDALADVVGGFIGLDDFHLKSYAMPACLASGAIPAYDSGSSHYLVPEDFATIYNLAPLYQAGIDGTGQRIAVVGASSVLLSDLRAFRTRYNLPANDPQFIPYSGVDPGFNGAQLEGNLDLEWAGAVAPKAAIYYVYGQDPFAATIAAINLNIAPVITISYGDCEIDDSAPYYRSIAQQGNAQGITILSASGDSGAAGCDQQASAPFATLGKTVTFPAVMPEVTGVGGTEFVEGSGTYWATTNDANFGSALSYIPEAAWNESSVSLGLVSGGGGASLYYPQPAWQTGSGVPTDGVRHVPDVALSAALHDAYYVTYQGGNGAVGGTSASAPSMAGIIALLNHYQVSKGFQKQPGLGNINPQLYRLAQSAPSVFHDITSGNNIVNCSQGSPDCLSGSYGYPTGPAYDMATGLGSVDANALVTQWNTKTEGVSINLFVDSLRVTVNDTIGATAILSTSGGTPTGTVDFAVGTIPLGSAPLITRDGQQVADLFFPAYRFGPGTIVLSAVYSGDAAFSSGGATKSVQIVPPTGAAAIVATGPDTVWPNPPPDAQGPAWQTTLTLREAAGVPAMITGFTIDGQAQPLAPYFPSPDIPPSATVSTTFVLRNLATPSTRIYGFTGVDSAGQAWSRSIPVNYAGTYPYLGDFDFTVTPLIVSQNTAADVSCQWAVQLNIDDLGGYLTTVDALVVGSVDLSSQIPAIFGTERLDAWSSLQGTLCFSGITPPATDLIAVFNSTGTFQQVSVSFTGPPAGPAKVSAAPAAITLAAPDAGKPAQAALAVNISDKTQPWTATIFPTNRTTAWLTASQFAGTGPGQIQLTASGAGFEPGVYHATIVIQSANAVPQSINVPVMFVLGGSASGTLISGAANSASYQAAASPGMLLAVFGSQLANVTEQVSTNPAPFSIAGVRATVNGLPAPLIYVSPGQLNIQIPYEAGAGPAVLGIDNNGQIAGWQFQIAPSAPGIFTDDKGILSPNASAPQGGIGTLYVTGAGEVSPERWTAFYATGPAAILPKPQLPVTVTVGGVPALVQYVGLAPGKLGITQINFVAPPSLPVGTQPVVVTIGGVSSPAAKVQVTAPPGTAEQ